MWGHLEGEAGGQLQVVLQPLDGAVSLPRGLQAGLPRLSQLAALLLLLLVVLPG